MCDACTADLASYLSVTPESTRLPPFWPRGCSRPQRPLLKSAWGFEWVQGFFRRLVSYRARHPAPHTHTYTLTGMSLQGRAPANEASLGGAESGLISPRCRRRAEL